MTTEATLQPWDRRPDEPDRAWSAFCVYRDSPRASRSHTKVAKALSLSSSGGRISAWAREWDWPTRVALYDAELDARFLDEMADRRKSILRGHVDRTARLSAVIERRISALEVEGVAEEVDGKELDALSRANKSCIESERISVGLPATVKEQRQVGADGPQVVVLSPALAEAHAQQGRREEEHARKRERGALDTERPQLALTTGD